MKTAVEVLALIVLTLLVAVEARNDPRSRESLASNAQSSAAAPAADGPIVRVSGGLISGSAMPRGVFMFASIPFAAPPVGALRWLPPQPAAPWSDVRDGGATPPVCVQDGPSGLIGVEDCLHLNVFSARVHANGSVSNATLAPVMVYIHGGSSLVGWSEWPINAQGDLVASHDVVTVTVNYRLNVFGYLALDVLSERQQRTTGHRSSGNYGLQDNAAALRWVRDNIAAFGGDPKRVTIWGQSTGGTNVVALYVSPLAKGLFHAVIALSASPVLRVTLYEAERDNREYIENAGCQGRHANATLACLLSLSANDAADAIPSRWLNSYDSGFPNRHWPDAGVVIVDGRVVPQELNAALREGNTVNVPLVYGHMAQELDIGPRDDLRALQSQADWELWLKSTLPAAGWNMTVVRALGAAYPVSDYGGDVQLTYETVIADNIICGGLLNMRNAARGVTAPVWHYLNEHQPAVAVQPLAFAGLSGWNCTHACHTWDQVLMLRAYPAGYASVADDDKGTALLRSLWVEELATTLTINASRWTPFNADHPRGRAAPQGHSAVLHNNGTAAAMVTELRADKCALLDSLGFTGTAWAN